MEKKFKKIDLKGKFVIAYDTLCEGNQCTMNVDKDGNESPALFDSADEAFMEIFDSNHSMLVSHMEDDMLEEFNEDVTPEMIQEMGEILDSKDVARMRKFMDEHPECDDNGEFVQPADEFIMGRKAIFTGQGLIIEGDFLFVEENN